MPRWKPEVAHVMGKHMGLTLKGTWAPLRNEAVLPFGQSETDAVYFIFSKIISLFQDKGLHIIMAKALGMANGPSQSQRTLQL